MFERLTDRARAVLALAASEARQQGQPCVGTPHILLGMIREGRGVAVVALSMMNLDLAEVLEQARAATEPAEDRSAGAPAPTADEPGDLFSDRARRMLANAAREARSFDEPSIGTEHLLLGLLCDRDCSATRALIAAGLRPEVGKAVLRGLLNSARQQPGEDLTADDLEALEAAEPDRPIVQLSSHAAHVDAMADEEAHRLNHDWIATEHLLLALLRDGDSNAARLLAGHGVDLSRAREAAARLLPAGARPSPAGRLSLTIGAQHVLHYAVQAAQPLDEDTLYLGTEHLLVGLLRETRSIAGEILRALHVEPEALCAEIQDMLAAGRIEPEEG